MNFWYKQLRIGIHNTFVCVFFQSFLKGETQIPSDEAFQNAVHSYNEIFLKAGPLIQSWHSSFILPFI
jgi:hypothetical protein